MRLLDNNPTPFVFTPFFISLAAAALRASSTISLNPRLPRFLLAFLAATFKDAAVALLATFAALAPPANHPHWPTDRNISIPNRMEVRVIAPAIARQPPSSSRFMRCM
ncbi:MAG TPA: hypothetical protein P5201_00005 [Aminobacteriaceae bacterium]|nr:hypothetical protein [Aminobacteriaceae bacterium]